MKPWHEERTTWIAVIYILALLLFVLSLMNMVNNQIAECEAKQGQYHRGLCIKQEQLIRIEQ
jgi:hypothetical protein